MHVYNEEAPLDTTTTAFGIGIASWLHPYYTHLHRTKQSKTNNNCLFLFVWSDVGLT